MLKLDIKTIPHRKQAYNTSGNYGVRKDGTIWVRISDLGNEDFEWLVLFHELIELYLTRKRKISWRKIDKFDIEFEKEREEDPLAIGDAEPGDDPSAPYFQEHQFASVIERMMAVEAGVNWKKYNKAFDRL